MADALEIAKKLTNKQTNYVRTCRFKKPQSILKTKYGHLHTIFVANERHGFLHVPKNSHCSLCLNKPNADEYNGLIFVYHGSRDIAFDSIFQKFTLLLKGLSDKKYLLFFGQSAGVIDYQPHIHPHYAHISYGELYWGIHSRQNMDEDLCYTKNAMNQITNIFQNNIAKYFLGHSNGGVFSLLLTVYMPNTFRAIISHQGGLGYDASFYIDFDLLKEPDQKTFIWFYTGTHDVHREACAGAYQLFKNMDFPCKLTIAVGESHGTLSAHCQRALLRFILNWDVFE